MSFNDFMLWVALAVVAEVIAVLILFAARVAFASLRRRRSRADEFGIPHMNVNAPMPRCKPPKDGDKMIGSRSVNELREELGLKRIEPTEIPPPPVKVRR